MASDTSNNESYNCINLPKSSTLTDTLTHNLPSINLTTPGSSSSSSTINSRSFNSVKGNHIERIAVSLLSVCFILIVSKPYIDLPESILLSRTLKKDDISSLD